MDAATREKLQQLLGSASEATALAAPAARKDVPKLAVASSAGVADLQTSNEDDRDYLTKRYSNGLRITYMSDPAADTAAVTLRVLVGSIHDPEEIPGLVNLLRSMMTGPTGSKAHYLRDYVRSVGGSFSSRIALKSTTYSIRVPAANLGASLQLLMETLTTPMLTEEHMNENIDSIESIYARELSQPLSQWMQTFKHINGDHPANRHRLGGVKTLREGKKLPSEVLAALKQFHSEYYSSDVTGIVLGGPLSINELEKNIDAIASIFPNKRAYLKLHNKSYNTAVIKKDNVPKLIYMPINWGFNTILFLFPLKENICTEMSKPWLVLNEIISLYAPNTLVQKLDRMGLARDITASITPEIPNILNISLVLPSATVTPGILSKIGNILFLYLRSMEKAFQTIEKRDILEKMLKQELTVRTLYYDLVAVPAKPNYYEALVDYLFNFPLENAVIGDVREVASKSDAVIDMLKCMRGDNVQVHVLTSMGRSDYSDEEPLTKTKYLIENISDELEKSWTEFDNSSESDLMKALEKEGLNLPKINPYIPEKFTVKDLPKDIKKNVAKKNFSLPKEVKLSKYKNLPESDFLTNGLKLFYKQNDQQRGTDVHIILHITIPALCGNAEERMAAKLALRAQKLLCQDIIAIGEAAAIATHVQESHMGSIVIRFDGYGDTILQYMQDFAAAFSKVYDIRYGEYGLFIHQALRDLLQAKAKATPVALCLKSMEKYLVTDCMGNDEEFNILRKMTPKNIKDALGGIFIKGNATALVIGNVLEEETVRAVANSFNTLGLQSSVDMNSIKLITTLNTNASLKKASGVDTNPQLHPSLSMKEYLIQYVQVLKNEDLNLKTHIPVRFFHVSKNTSAQNSMSTATIFIPEMNDTPDSEAHYHLFSTWAKQTCIQYFQYNTKTGDSIVPVCEGISIAGKRVLMYGLAGLAPGEVLGKKLTHFVYDIMGALPPNTFTQEFIDSMKAVFLEEFEKFPRNTADEFEMYYQETQSRRYDFQRIEKIKTAFSEITPASFVKYSQDLKLKVHFYFQVDAAQEQQQSKNDVLADLMSNAMDDLRKESTKDYEKGPVTQGWVKLPDVQQFRKMFADN